MKYRSEIDGLRALAVLPVIFFHAGFSAFQGGFVGVDVFFVISGYLITTILLSDMEKGRFSLITFYERRFRRILPALFFVMMATLPFALMWLMPSELKAYGQSWVAVALFSSNILFWLTSGYFETVAELKPLLHTWSLGVEEQYYVFFPLLLMLLWRRGRRWLLPALLLIAVVSLAASEWAVRQYPSAAFYLLPFRAWELLTGGFIAWYFSRHDRLAQSLAANQWGSLAGLVFLLVAIFGYNRHIPFPGISAVLPVLGTALIIIFATPQTWVGKLLCNRFMVQIGLISYSAYLWHNPLFAFARVRSEFHVESAPLMLALAVLSLVLAYFTWKYVEAPFRRKEGFNRRQIFQMSFCGSFLIFAVGLASHFYFQAKEPQIDYQWGKHVRQYECLIQDSHENRQQPECYAEGSNTVLLWGDSHAASLYPGLAGFARNNGIALTQLNQSACPPMLGLPQADVERKNCSRINQRIIADIAHYRYNTIILHSMWLYDRAPASYEEISNHLEETIRSIYRVSPKTKVLVIGNIPRWYISAERAYTRVSDDKAKYTDKEEELLGGAVLLPELEATLKRTAESNRATFIAPSVYLCESGSQEHRLCLLSLDGSREGMAYIDANHLSKAGADTLISRMAPELKAALQP
ncbi:MAG: acyltransferase family protein [Neisseria sp.]|nr:acyltransferase family protein [Neisseria sp.]